MSDATERRSEIVRDLSAVRAKIREVLTGGASISISGGISVSQPSLADLRTHESHLARQLYLADGGAMRTAPDFSGGTGGVERLPST